MFDNNFSQRFRQGASWLGARLKPAASQLLSTDKAQRYMSDLGKIAGVAMAGKRAYDQFKQGDEGWMDTAGAAVSGAGDALGAAQSLYNRGQGDVGEIRSIIKKRRRRK